MMSCTGPTFGPRFTSSARCGSTRKPARWRCPARRPSFGLVDPEFLPVNETFKGYPREAYGRSKWLATSAGLAERLPLEVVVARVFNPIGPGTPPTQAFGRFADRLTDPDADPLNLVVGDLDALMISSTCATWHLP